MNNNYQTDNEAPAFIAYDDDGNLVEYTVLAMLSSEDDEKQFLIFTDNSVDKRGTLRITAGIFDEENGGIKPITDNKEWRMIKKVVKKMKKGDFD